MAQIDEWLDTIGLGRSAALFADHDIDLQVLPELCEADLEKLGISLGHRKKLLKAIAALAGEAQAAPAVRPWCWPKPCSPGCSRSICTSRSWTSCTPARRRVG